MDWLEAQKGNGGKLVSRISLIKSNLLKVHVLSKSYYLYFNKFVGISVTLHKIYHTCPGHLTRDGLTNL